MHKFYNTPTKYSKPQNFVDLQKIKHTLQQAEETYEDWVKTQKELTVDPCNIKPFSTLMKNLGKTWKFPDTYLLMTGVHKRKYKKPKYPEDIPSRISNTLGIPVELSTKTNSTKNTRLPHQKTNARAELQLYNALIHSQIIDNEDHLDTFIVLSVDLCNKTSSELPKYIWEMLYNDAMFCCEIALKNLQQHPKPGDNLFGIMNELANNYLGTILSSHSPSLEDNHKPSVQYEEIIQFITKHHYNSSLLEMYMNSILLISESKKEPRSYLQSIEMMLHTCAPKERVEFLIEEAQKKSRGYLETLDTILETCTQQEYLDFRDKLILTKQVAIKHYAENNSLNGSISTKLNHIIEKASSYGVVKEVVFFMTSLRDILTLINTSPRNEALLEILNVFEDLMQPSNLRVIYYLLSQPSELRISTKPFHKLALILLSQEQSCIETLKTITKDNRYPYELHWKIMINAQRTHLGLNHKKTYDFIHHFQKDLFKPLSSSLIDHLNGNHYASMSSYQYTTYNSIDKFITNPEERYSSFSDSTSGFNTPINITPKLGPSATHTLKDPNQQFAPVEQPMISMKGLNI